MNNAANMRQRSSSRPLKDDDADSVLTISPTKKRKTRTGST
jgi:hypothetical protein